MVLNFLASFDLKSLTLFYVLTIHITKPLTTPQASQISGPVHPHPTSTRYPYTITFI